MTPLSFLRAPANQPVQVRVQGRPFALRLGFGAAASGGFSATFSAGAIPASLITGLQAAINAYQPDLVVVQRNTPASDAYGGWADAWSVVSQPAGLLRTGGGLYGWLMPIPERFRESVLANQVRPEELWWLSLPVGTDIAPADRVWVSRDQGVNYTVFSVDGTELGQSNPLTLVLRVRKITDSQDLV